MEELLRFLQKYEIWIYVLLGGVGLLYVRQLIRAWQQLRGSVFGLERDLAQRRLAAILTVLALSGLLVLSEFIVVSFVAPSTAQSALLPTPTLDLLAAPTATLPATSDVTVTPTVEGTASPVLSEGCVAGEIEWSFPADGASLSDSVELKGTVNVPNLGFYKYEYSQSGSDTWVTIAAGNQQRVNGTIGFWNTSDLVAGDYLLRLVVADSKNTFFPVCVIKVRVVKP